MRDRGAVSSRHRHQREGKLLCVVSGEEFGAGWVECRSWVRKSRGGRRERDHKLAWDVLVKFINL